MILRCIINKIFDATSNYHYFSVFSNKKYLSKFFVLEMYSILEKILY